MYGFWRSGFRPRPSVGAAPTKVSNGFTTNTSSVRKNSATHIIETIV